MRRILWTILSFLLMSVSIHAQVNVPDHFRHFGYEHGLSNTFVVDIAQDCHGIIWLATESGLFRFDGVGFQEYNIDNSPLTARGLNDLFYDEVNDKLWIASKSSLFRMDCRTLQLENVGTYSGEPANTQTLCPSSDGNLWVATREGYISHVDVKTGKFTSLEAPKYKRVGCISLLEYKDCLYIGHIQEGMTRLNLKSGEVKDYYNDLQSPGMLPDNRVYCIFVDHYENLWLGTYQGLALYNPNTDSFITYRHDPEDAQSLVSDHIYSVSEPVDGQLWVCTDLGGISILNLSQLPFTGTERLRFRNIVATYNNLGLSSNNVRVALPDEFGNIWVGMHSSGLDCISVSDLYFHTLSYPESASSLKNRVARSLCMDEDGYLWIGGENEVSKWKEGALVTRYPLDDYLTRTGVLVYSLLPKGKYLYIGLYDNGLLRMDRTTGEIHRIDIGPLIDVNTLYEDTDGSVLVGTRYGLRILKDDKLQDASTYNKDLSFTSVFGFVRDKEGLLWVATYGSNIFIYDAHQKLLKNLNEADGLRNFTILDMKLAQDGTVWCATQNGFAHISKSGINYSILSYGKDEGLRNTYVHAIQEDASGNIWVSTDLGISCLDKQHDKINNYGAQDGTSEGNFSEGAVTRWSKNGICFGSQNGVCYFFPDKVLADASLSPIVIDGENPFYIPYGQQTFTLHFYVKNFMQLNSVEYAYCIPEISHDWVSLGNEHQVTFRNLRYGKYTFKVRARLRNGLWNDANVTSIHFEIEPPIWLTWFAKCLYALLGLCLLCFLFQSYKRRVLLRSKHLIETRNIQNERLLNKERLQFYTNITHELRTPLTLILGPLDDFRNDTDLSDSNRAKLNVMYKNGTQLLELINQLLDFRKTETANRKLIVQRFSLASLVNEIGVQFGELNVNDAVKFNIDTPSCNTDIVADSGVITTILNNLLSNAIKYTNEGKVTLSLKWKAAEVPPTAVLTVSDTGKGISQEALPHIFESYYRAGEEQETVGTGIGLALVKSLADLHRAELNVESEEGKGSIFSLTLHLDATYPNARHLEASAPVANDHVKEEEQDQSSQVVILAVEDNEDIRGYIASSLASTYEVVTARNGAEGLQKAFEMVPDLIITDIMMPEMDGLEMCKHLKNDIRTSHIPVIFLTAKDSMDDQSIGYEAGADSYLTKPFSGRLIQSRVQNLLQSRHDLAQHVAKMVISPGESSEEDLADGRFKLNPLDKEWLEKFNRIVRENLDAPDLNIAFMEEKMSMSHSSLYRKIKAVTGLSGNEYVRKIKLGIAREYLEAGGMTVQQVAFSSGFSNVSYFIASYKKEFGCTPGESK